MVGFGITPIRAIQLPILRIQLWELVSNGYFARESLRDFLSDRTNRGDIGVDWGRQYEVFKTGWNSGSQINVGPHNPGIVYNIRNFSIQKWFPGYLQGWRVPFGGYNLANGGGTVLKNWKKFFKKSVFPGNWNMNLDEMRWNNGYQVGVGPLNAFQSGTEVDLGSKQ